MTGSWPNRRRQPAGRHCWWGRRARRSSGGRSTCRRFTGGHTLVAHLRMTGRFVQHTYVTTPPKSERFRLLLDDGTAVGFQDSRRFGRIAVHPASTVDHLPDLASLEPDALVEPTSAERLA